MGWTVEGLEVAFPSSFGRHWTTNDFLQSVSSHSDEAIQEILQKAAHLGFHKRYRVNASTTSVDLMVHALKDVMDKQRVAPKDIDYLISVTTTSPKYTTATAPMVAARVGLDCPGIEIKSGCASSLYALHMAGLLIAGGMKRVAVVLGETLSKTLPSSHPLSFALADGGAALLLTGNEAGKGIIQGVLGMDGSQHVNMGFGGTLPPNEEDFRLGNYQMTYNKAADEVVEKAWLILAEYIKQTDPKCRAEQLIMHEASAIQRSIFAKGMVVSPERLPSVLSEVGNCGPVSIFANLKKHMNSAGGEKFWLASVGGGISAGAIQIQL
ncbi:MAG: 3-oxoacyl-[acyl-carrier-protein] synthase III [Flammeovirgaceae bacterium]|jgi:3-oxoacyl-[acyl-carrier-protein] synthase III